MMNDIKSRDNWSFGLLDTSFRELSKEDLFMLHNRMMYNRSIQMFEYENLPETIPKKNLEILLQSRGYCCITKVNGELYALECNTGGTLDANYNPTTLIVSNPWLNFSKEIQVSTFNGMSPNGVFAMNDSTYFGLYFLNQKYAMLLADWDLTIDFKLVEKRLPYLFSANDTDTKDSFDKLMKDVKNGKSIYSILNNGLDEINSLTNQPFASNSNGDITELIEISNYLKSSWYLDLGLTANNNMKRETINSNESSLNDDIILPLMDDMLNSRKKMCEECNNLFGTNIKVDFSSAWKKIREEINIALNEQKTQDSQVKEDKEEGEKNED